MKLKSILTYLIVIIFNLGVGFLLNYLFFENNSSNYIMVTCGLILLFILIVYIICQKKGYKLDLFAYNITDKIFQLLNDLFIGNLFSIPLAMFFSLLL